MKYSRMFMFLVLMAAAAASFGAYNAAKPADNDYVSDVPALVRENFRAIKDDAIVNAGTVAGLSVGNASGNIPRNNGTLNTNLSADYLDGYHASAFNASDALNLRLDGSRAMTGNLKLNGNWLSNDGDSEGVYVGATGRVGIGTSAPSESFVVAGTNVKPVIGKNSHTTLYPEYDSQNATALEIHAANTGTNLANLVISNALTSSYGSSVVFATSGTAGSEKRYAMISGNPESDSSVTVNGVMQFFTTKDGTLSEVARMTKQKNLLIGTTTDDGTNKLQVNGGIKGAGFTMADDGNTVCWGSNVYVQGNNTTSNLTLKGGTVNVNGTLTRAGNTVWDSGNDGADSGLDADKVRGVNLAPQEKTAQTMGAAGWFRIAQSASGIYRHHGIISIDWAGSGYHGAATFAAGNHCGGTGGTGLNLLGLSFYPTGAPTGITKARIVYHTTYLGNYAYLEVYADRNLGNIIAYRITQGLGWTLINATAGSIPSGYTSQEIAFADCNLNHGKASFATSGSWTCPPGVWAIWVTAAGGGGGGGCGTTNATTSSGGGGGGSGAAVRRQKYTVVPGTAYTITIGAGGQGADTRGAAGNTGGTTSIGSLVSLAGGVGGSGLTGGAAGGSGGTAGATASSIPKTSGEYAMSPGAEGGSNIAGGDSGIIGGGGRGGNAGGSAYGGEYGGDGFVNIEW